MDSTGGLNVNKTLYEWADCLYNSSPRYDCGFTQLLSVSPFLLTNTEWQFYHSRLDTIKKYFANTIKVFRKSLNKDLNPKISKWLLNETPKSLGVEYHKSLECRHYTPPLFFRTDEARIGRIIEIQCPGSLWGELQLVYEYVLMLDLHRNIKKISSPADVFARNLYRYLKDTPIVHYLIDNSSMPSGVRFFIERTRPNIKYFGIDKDINRKQCNFIRTHSFFGLCAENDFKPRLKDVGKSLFYDYPPHVLFDQKATLILPFWSLTRDFFSDEIRDLFVFSTPLLPDGIELEDGSCLSVEEFSSLSRSQRSYYLKYAGSDVSINWGSKAVFRLNNMSSKKCLNLLKECLSEFNNGKIWLIQKEEKQDDTISYLDRNGKRHIHSLRGKYSAFYGPHEYIGSLAMHRNHNKVHGQNETVLSYCLFDEDCKRISNEQK